MRLDKLENLYIDQLRDIYDGEKKLVELLRKMSETAKSDDLKELFGKHMVETRNHIERLDEIFEDRGENPGGVRCFGIEGMIKEVERYMDAENADPIVRDAALIASSQKIQHYEIATYGTAQAYAIQLEHMEDARKLGKSLEEESKADEKMTKIAESHVNVEAMA